MEKIVETKSEDAEWPVTLVTLLFTHGRAPKVIKEHVFQRCIGSEISAKHLNYQMNDSVISTLGRVLPVFFDGTDIVKDEGAEEAVPIGEANGKEQKT